MCPPPGLHGGMGSWGKAVLAETESQNAVELSLQVAISASLELDFHAIIQSFNFSFFHQYFYLVSLFY